MELLFKLYLNIIKLYLYITIKTLGDGLMSIELDDYQKEAVRHNTREPLLIQAGPGAGKTRVIIERIKFLLKQGASPESFLVITFSRKAAKELKERLADAEDGIDMHDVNKMQISTIHSFCAELLRDNGKSGFRVLDDDFDERRSMFIRRYRKELGFTREAHISGKNLLGVLYKFDEYTTFNVDVDTLKEYIKDKYPVSQEYIDLIDSCGEGDEFEYPYDEVFADDDLKQSQYNAQYLAVAEAYPKYLELLENHNYLDYTLLQKKALELLDYDSSVAENTKYKNVLIDEFQDTDPIQMKIFAHFIGHQDSFTVVGDDDQSIYAFRGSFPKFFKNFKDDFDDVEVKNLPINYRSDIDIVDLNEKFVKPIRTLDKELRPRDDAAKGYVKSIPFYDKEEQANNIALLVKYLKENNKVKYYSDIGILFRSVTTDPMMSLISALDAYHIPFDLSVTEPLISKKEIKAVITLIWYLKSSSDSFIFSSWEKKWLNIRTFANDYFNLSGKTIDLLRKTNLDYETKVIKQATSLCEDNNIEIKGGLLSFEEVFKLPQDIQDQLFEEVGRPVDLSVKNRDELIDFGITNENDLDFFVKLNNLKKQLESDDSAKVTLLEIFYQLLDMIGIVGDKFEEETKENRELLFNLAYLTRTIANYEEIVYKYDLNGLFWYMNANLEKYNSPEVDKDKHDAVQLMTIHKSKGLEFPVVIVGNIRNKMFPKEINIDKTLNKELPLWDYRGFATYPTPIEFQRNKEFNRKEEIEQQNIEEKRVLYVAMTRAENMLFLSNALTKTGKESHIITEMKEQSPFFTDISITQKADPKNPNKLKIVIDDEENIPSAYHDEPKPVEEENIEMSFTKYKDYNKCPHDYNVKHNYGFVSSPNDKVVLGTIAHSMIDQIHQKHLNGYEITKRDIIDIFEKTEKYNRNVDKVSKSFEYVKTCILNYWEKHGSNWEIIASEYPFNVIKTGYTLIGQIDLIIKEGNDITIIDFKTTNKAIKEENPETYQKEYIEQLSMYAMALREDPHYKDYNIKQGMIYTLLNNKCNYFDLNDDLIDRMEKNVEKTVDNIKHELYGRCDDPNCKSCNRFKSYKEAKPVVNDVKSKLTGNKEQDRKTIIDQIVKEDNSEQAITELTEMSWKYLTDEEKAKVSQALIEILQKR